MLTIDTPLVCFVDALDSSSAIPACDALDSSSAIPACRC